MNRVGVVVVSHGAAGHEMLMEVNRLLGEASTDSIFAVTVEFGEARAVTLGHIQAAVNQVDSGKGVVVLCDLWGSTPANCCTEAQLSGPTELMIVSGLNLPMLVKVASSDRAALGPRDLADVALRTAQVATRIIGPLGGQGKGAS